LLPNLARVFRKNLRDAQERGSLKKARRVEGRRELGYLNDERWAWESRSQSKKVSRNAHYGHISRGGTKGGRPPKR